MARVYPALDVFCSGAVDEDWVGRLVAELTDNPALEEVATTANSGEDGPVAVEPVAVEDDGHDASVRLFFASPAARDRAAGRLVASDPTLRCQAVEVPDDDWAARSQAALGAVRVGNVVVAPPWVANTGDGVHITIQPSMGFGTAHHASTRLCLCLMQDLPLNGARVLDIGTGSGVLAITAARLGASTVVAIDSDPDAIQSAQENVALNRVSSIVDVAPVPLDASSPLPGGFDVVLANLTGALLQRCAATVAAALAGNGTAILSGVLREEAGDVVQAFERAGLRVAKQIGEEEWTGFALRPDATP